MLTRERYAALGFAVLGIAAGFAVDQFTGQPDWVAVAALLVVGLAGPRLFVRLADGD